MCYEIPGDEPIAIYCNITNVIYQSYSYPDDSKKDDS